MQRFIPLIVLVVLLLSLGLIFGPGMLRGWQLRKTVGSMLDSAARGDLSTVSAHALPAQRPQLDIMLGHLPQSYSERIESLRMARYEMVDGTEAWTLVNCRIEGSGGPSIYQGKLLWRYTQGEWQWDVLGSYAAPFSPSGEPSWISIEEALALADNLQ